MNSSTITASYSGKSIFISHLSQTLLNKRIEEASKDLLQPNHFGSIEPYGVHRIKRTPCWQQLFNPAAVGSMYKLDYTGKRPKQSIMKNGFEYTSFRYYMQL